MAETEEAPNWLLKLEEQRAKRLKVKLGHEAGAGAPCQLCGALCPGLDLHFWRKICKICKCGKEDHDICDEDLHGFVQFTLLGSKPVKTKGILLKGSNDAVTLEFTPQGSSNDVKKYLDELPQDLLAVKGSEAAKLRKQRLQKQMPAHDIDPTLCHALTDEEIKQLEEYVAFIRKHSVGQGSIIRIPLHRGIQHLPLNAKIVTETITTNQMSVNEMTSNLVNNLQSLSLQHPTNQKIHPLTTINVERHQEQYENPNYTVNNPTNIEYIPGFVNPSEQHQVPVKVGLKDIKYAVNYGESPPPINEKSHPKYGLPNRVNISGAAGGIHLKPNECVEPINDRQVPCFAGYVTDVTYPTGQTVLRARNPINPTETHQNFASVGLLHDLNYGTSEIQDEIQRNECLDEANSNVSQIQCHECKGALPEGGVGVSAERTSNLWHAECFNCHTCKQPLADLLYFYHKDTENIYCGRDYAILKGIPRCSACDELIFVREYCLAEGSTFHVKHFCCFECDQPLAGKSYLMEASQPVCLDCFESLKAESCRDCSRVIRPEEQGVCLQDLHWHATDCCFVCRKCRKPLLGQKMLLRNECLFCSDFCYKNY